MEENTPPERIKMLAKKIHGWRLSYSAARDLQESLAAKVEFTPLRKKAKLVAGIDCAFS